MPCALTAEPGNYPDYLKKILKEIKAENDDEAKACACSLITPTTDEGCAITDEDGKVLAFPFCLDTTAPAIDPNYERNDLALTYKQAMKFYWHKSIRVEVNLAVSHYSDGDRWTATANGSVGFSLTNKELICGIGKGSVAVGYYNESHFEICGDNKFCMVLQRPAIRKPDEGSSSSYDGYAGGDIFAWRTRIYNGARGWIDKQNQKIYPYFNGSFNMFGNVGWPIPMNGKMSGSLVSFDVVTTDHGWAPILPIGLKCGTAKITLI